MAYGRKEIDLRQLYVRIYAVLYVSNAISLFEGFVRFLPPSWQQADLEWLKLDTRSELENAFAKEAPDLVDSIGHDSIVSAPKDTTSHPGVHVDNGASQGPLFQAQNLQALIAANSSESVQAPRIDRARSSTPATPEESPTVARQARAIASRPRNRTNTETLVSSRAHGPSYVPVKFRPLSKYRKHTHNECGTDQCHPEPKITNDDNVVSTVLPQGKPRKQTTPENDSRPPVKLRLKLTPPHNKSLPIMAKSALLVKEGYDTTSNGALQKAHMSESAPQASKRPYTSAFGTETNTAPSKMVKSHKMAMSYILGALSNDYNMTRNASNYSSTRTWITAGTSPSTGMASPKAPTPEGFSDTEDNMGERIMSSSGKKAKTDLWREVEAVNEERSSAMTEADMRAMALGLRVRKASAQR